MKYRWIAVAVIAVAWVSAAQVSAQVDAKEEEQALEDRNEVSGESVEEEWLGEENEKVQTEVPEGDRKGGRCAIDPPSSTPSPAPIAALLVAVGLIAFRRLRAAP